MADLDLPWKSDFGLAPNGDLALVESGAQTQQSIIRRLYSSVSAYIWPKIYGLGLLQRIGNVAATKNIAALVRSGMKLEPTVARLPVPVVTVTESAVDPGLFVINIKYTDAITGQPVALKFEVPSS